MQGEPPADGASGNKDAVARPVAKPASKGFSPLGNNGSMIDLPPGFPTLKTLKVEDMLDINKVQCNLIKE